MANLGFLFKKIFPGGKQDFSLQKIRICFWQIFGAGGALIQKKNKEKEKGKGKEERREKRKKERGEFNLEDPMFLFNFHSFFQKIIK